MSTSLHVDFDGRIGKQKAYKAWKLAQNQVTAGEVSNLWRGRCEGILVSEISKKGFRKKSRQKKKAFGAKTRNRTIYE